MNEALKRLLFSNATPSDDRNATAEEILGRLEAKIKELEKPPRILPKNAPEDAIVLVIHRSGNLLYRAEARGEAGGREVLAWLENQGLLVDPESWLIVTGDPRGCDW